MRAILVISFALQTVIFFADGKKLYFDFVKVIFRLSAEVKVFIHNLPEGQISLRKQYHCRRQYHLPKGKYNLDKAITFIALSLKSCAFFGDDVFTAQVNFVINFTIFLRFSLVIKINRFLLRFKIGGKSPLFFGNAVRISPF